MKLYTQAVEEAKAKHWKRWAIDGMPKDKMRLAEGTWDAALKTIEDAGYVVVPVAFMAQVIEAVAVLEDGTDYEKTHVSAILRDGLDAAEAAQREVQNTIDCDHNWVSAVNEVIASGEICTKCLAIQEEGE